MVIIGIAPIKVLHYYYFVVNPVGLTRLCVCFISVYLFFIFDLVKEIVKEEMKDRKKDKKKEQQKQIWQGEGGQIMLGKVLC